MVTDLKKCQDQELMAANCIVPDLCEKNCCVSFYAGCEHRFLDSLKVSEKKLK